MATFALSCQNRAALRPYGPQSLCLSPGHLQETFANPWLRENCTRNGRKHPSPEEITEIAKLASASYPVRTHLVPLPPEGPKPVGPSVAALPPPVPLAFLDFLG